MLELIRKRFGWVAKEPAPSSGASERVALGAALLDERQPNWWMMVRPEAIDLLSPSLCVLGQVYGNFGRAAELMRFPRKEGRLSDFGFCPQESATVTLDGDMLDVKRAWKRAVEARRAASGMR